MFAFDEQSDFQKPFEVERKRVCVCVCETSQTALGAVCAAAIRQTQTCFGLKITIVCVDCVLNAIINAAINSAIAMLSTNVKRSDFQ